MKMKYIEKNNLLLAILVNSVLFFLLYLLFSPTFMTNDDTGMMLIVSGVNGAAPSEFMIFSNIIIGYFLKFLYTLNNTIPWYGIYEILILYASQTVILYIILKKEKNIYLSLFIYFLYFGLISFYVLINLQFTIIATITVFSGVLLLFFDINNKSFGKFFWGTLLVVLGSLIRWHSFLLVILLSFPFVLFHFFKDEKLEFVGFKQLKMPLILMSFSILLSFMLYQYNAYQYNKNGYEKFYETNKYRALLMDYNLLEEQSNEQKKQKLEAVNWSENDYDIFKSWFFVDTTRYNVINYKKLCAGVDKRTKISDVLNWFKVLIFKRTKTLMNLCFLVFNVLLLLLFHKNKKTLIFFIS